MKRETCTAGILQWLSGCDCLALIFICQLQVSVFGNSTKPNPLDTQSLCAELQTV